MRYRARRRTGRYAAFAMLAGVSTAAGAQETQTGLSVSTGMSVESNPYNEVGNGGAQVAATAELRPSLLTRTETTTIDLSGGAQFRQFFKRYGLEDNYNANAQIASRLSEVATLRSRFGFSYNEGGFGSLGRPALSAADPTEFPTPQTPILDPALADITILGLRTRTQVLSFGVGGDTKLNSYSRVALDISGVSSRYKDAGFGDYDTIAAELNYSHQLSEFTSVGLIASASRTDYIGARQGDARIASLQASFERRLSASWSLTLSGGLSHTRTKWLPGMPDETFTALTARLRFCRQSQYSQLCISGNRSPEPTALGQVRVSNSLAADYNLRLSERETVSVAGSFSRTSEGRASAGVVAQPAVTFLSGSARYDRRIAERLTGFVSTNISKIKSPFSSDRVNAGVNVGVQMRFGAIQ